MREENTDFFEDFSDLQLTALKRDGSLSCLKSDIISQMSLKNSNTDILNEIATNYSDRLNYALTLKQLQMYYYQNATMGDSISLMRYEVYENRYNVERKAFRDFETTEAYIPLVINGTMNMG
jgi:hypothetical protein